MYGYGADFPVFDPEAAAYMGPIGLEHFFDAFSLTVKRDLRGAAAVALDIPLHEIQPNLTVKQRIAERFNLTPIRAPDRSGPRLCFRLWLACVSRGLACVSGCLVSPCGSLVLFRVARLLLSVVRLCLRVFLLCRPVVRFCPLAICLM